MNLLKASNSFNFFTFENFIKDSWTPHLVSQLLLAGSLLDFTLSQRIANGSEKVAIGSVQVPPKSHFYLIRGLQLKEREMYL